jgi:hypothetical protein
MLVQSDLRRSRLTERGLAEFCAKFPQEVSSPLLPCGTRHSTLLVRMSVAGECAAGRAVAGDRLIIIGPYDVHVEVALDRR